MNRLYQSVLLTFLSVMSLHVCADDTTPVKPLEVGVVPFLSSRVIITNYEPMRQYLERTLGKPVKIYTSSSFKSFFTDAQKGEFDMVVSAAHFARILQKENNFIPLVRYESGARGLVMTAVNSPIKTLEGLRGKVIAVPNQLSLASIVSMSRLREYGLNSTTDYKILDVPSFTSAILAIEKGDAIAAISAPAALTQMTKELRDSVKPILDTGEYINLIILAHPRLGKTYTQLLQNSLLKFGKDPNLGKQFIVSTGIGAIIPVSSTDMNTLDKYVADTKRLLNKTP